MLIITTTAELKDLVTELKKEPVIAIDTEFVRRDTYYAKLCLIQVATSKNIYVIDPLKLDLDSFKEVLTDKNIVKVFHAPHQDLGIFYNILNTITINIFDTQEAVKFLGIKSQISYQEICSKILNIQIEKEQQFREWNLRPLSTEMLEYAAQDVTYLIQLYNKLKQMLEEKIIYINFCYYMEHFAKKEFYQVKFDDMWKKVKTTERSQSFFRRLQILAAFRENCAIELNIPRVHAISDKNLVEITLKLPKTLKEFSALGIRTQLTPSHISKLLDICAGLGK